MNRLPGPLGRLGETLHLMRKLAPYGRRHRVAFSTAAVLAVSQVLIDLARPWPIKIVLDQVILGQPWALLPEALAGPDRRMALLLTTCAAVLLLAALSGFLAYSRTLLLARAGQQIVAKLRYDLFKRLLRLPLGFHDQQRSGDVVVRLTGDAAAMRTLLAEGGFSLAQELLWTIGIFTVMAILDLRLALAAAITFPLVGAVVSIFGRRLKAAARRQRAKEGLIATAVGESLSAVPVIQAYGLEKEAARRFRIQNRKSLRSGLAATRFEGAMSRWAELALAAGTSLILLLGVQRVISGQLTAGELLVLVSYGRNLYKPLRRIVTRSARLMKSAASGERILDILDLENDLTEIAEPLPMVRARGGIEFRGVGFEYRKGEPVLQDVDLSIAPGEKLGLIGNNGSGKTTLLSLIPRLRDVTAGGVFVDGQDVRELALAELRRNAALVFQDTVLFDGDILENIRLARPEASEEELLNAAVRGGVMEFVEDLPAGLGTGVGEGGTALSGGQRQRIALARALLRDAPILLLDEPTSSLDGRANAQITRQLLSSLDGRTIVLVSHGGELLEMMDRIAVMDAGRCIDVGDASRILRGHRRMIEAEKLRAPVPSLPVQRALP